MASLIIVVIACSKSLYKASLKRRNRKRESELLAAFAHAEKPARVRRRSIAASSQPHRRRILNAGGATTYNLHSMLPPRVSETYEMSPPGLLEFERASTLASEDGEGRRRMSDESTIAELARDGVFTART